jgi:hypothetical protein
MPIRSTGLSLTPCDRCKKDVAVVDEPKADYYREFAKREDQGSQMFQALQLKTDGTDVSAHFEFICPKCEDAVSTYMNKILMVKEEPKTKPKTEEEKKAEAEAKKAKADADKKAKAEAKAKADADKKAEADKKVEIKDETTPPAEETPPPDGEPGLSFDEEEMFAG